jgi:plasmid stability protein
MQDERLFVSLPDTLKVEAKVKAAREGVTLSAVIRTFLKAWLAGDLGTPTSIGGEKGKMPEVAR